MPSTLVIRKRDLYSTKIKDYEMNVAIDRLERSIKICKNRFQVRVYFKKRNGMIMIVGENIWDVQGAAENILHLINHTVCMERRRRLIEVLSTEL